MENVEFALLAKKIRETWGFDISGYKESFTARLIAGRMHECGAKTYFEYGKLLQKDKGEYFRLIDALGINVSEFFRDPGSFNALWGVMEEVFLRKTEARQDIVRIWSVACAEGEEPYSISMMAREMLGELHPSFKVSIYATDIDGKAIAAAKEGVYRPERMKNVKSQYLAKYFEGSGKGYAVKEEVKKSVRFMQMDVLREVPLSGMDIIVCRNLLIYFDEKAQLVLLSRLCDALLPGGHLFLGGSEALPEKARCRYELVDSAARIYRKKA